jgi:hypothetical protein
MRKYIAAVIEENRIHDGRNPPDNQRYTDKVQNHHINPIALKENEGGIL